jgi:hypothetical protein
MCGQLRNTPCSFIAKIDFPAAAKLAKQIYAFALWPAVDLILLPQFVTLIRQSERQMRSGRTQINSPLRWLQEKTE